MTYTIESDPSLIRNYNLFLTFALNRDSNRFTPFSTDTMTTLNTFIDTLTSLPRDPETLKVIVSDTYQTMNGYEYYDDPNDENIWHFFRDATVELSETVTGQNTAREDAADVYLELFKMAQPNVINVN